MSQSSGIPRTDNDPFLSETTSSTRGAHAADPLVVPNDGREPVPATSGGTSGRDGGPRDSSGGGAKDEAKEQGRQVAGDAKAKGQEVAGTAKEQGRQVKDEAKGQAKGLLDSAKTELNSQASTQTERAASGLSSLGDQLAALAKGEPQDGQVTDLVRQAGDKVSEAARWMEGREPADLLQDVSRFAARRPGTFLAIAAGVGILAGRFTRGAAADAKDDGDDTRGASSPSRSSTGPSSSAAEGYGSADALGTSRTTGGYGAAGTTGGYSTSEDYR